MKELLSSSRIRLRAPEPEDLELMYRIENSMPLWHLSACNVPYSRFQLKQYIETTAHDIFIDRQVRFVMELQEGLMPVGAVDLTDFNPQDGRAEVGIVVDQAFRRQGLAAEALHLLVDYAREVVGMHQLYAYVPESNVASEKLFASCGFREIAQLPDWLFVDGHYQSVLLFQRLLME